MLELKKAGSLYFPLVRSTYMLFSKKTNNVDSNKVKSLLVFYIMLLGYIISAGLHFHYAACAGGSN